MKRYAVILMVLVSGLAFAQEGSWGSNPSWFAGLSIARAEYNDHSSRFGSSVIDKHNGAESFNLNGGYQFNRFFGLEGGYVHIGGVNTTFSSSSIETRMKLVRFLGYGRYPIGERWAAIGKIGFFAGKIKGRLSGVTTNDYSNSENGTVIELGVQYNFAPNWIGVFEAGRYDFSINDFDFSNGSGGDVVVTNLDRSYDYLQLGVRYHF